MEYGALYDGIYSDVCQDAIKFYLQKKLAKL